MATITVGTTTHGERSVRTRVCDRMRAFAASWMAVVSDSAREPVRDPRRVPGNGIDTFYRAGASRL
jgi:hypothetical protein